MTHISYLTPQRSSTLELTPEPTLAARQRMALRDLREAAGMWRLCWTLAWLDIRLRYSGSMLGPFWLTLSTGIMVGAMGGIYSQLFHVNLHEYLPFLALSLVLWGFLGTLVGDACVGYTSAESTIRSMRMPYILFAARIVVRNVLVLAHNLLAIIAVFALLRIVPAREALWAVPAFALWLVDGVAVCVLLGALCARFRDIPPIVGSVMQILFLVTPVIWKPELLGRGRDWMLTYNPMYPALEIVRSPLLGSIPSLQIYASAILFSLVLCGGTWLLFARVRARIPFWV
jgi:lipopolysaccharide transport system permease protein